MKIIIWAIFRAIIILTTFRIDGKSEIKFLDAAIKGIAEPGGDEGAIAVIGGVEEEQGEFAEGKGVGAVDEGLGNEVGELLDN